jgi:hypothetical protein
MLYRYFLEQGSVFCSAGIGETHWLRRRKPGTLSSPLRSIFLERMSDSTYDGGGQVGVARHLGNVFGSLSVAFLARHDVCGTAQKTIGCLLESLRKRRVRVDA